MRAGFKEEIHHASSDDEYDGVIERWEHPWFGQEGWFAINLRDGKTWRSNDNHQYWNDLQGELDENSAPPPLGHPRFSSLTQFAFWQHTISSGMRAIIRRRGLDPGRGP